MLHLTYPFHLFSCRVLWSIIRAWSSWIVMENQEGRVIRVPQLRRGKEDVAITDRVITQSILIYICIFVTRLAHGLHDISSLWCVSSRQSCDIFVWWYTWLCFHHMVYCSSITRLVHQAWTFCESCSCILRKHVQGAFTNVWDSSYTQFFHALLLLYSIHLDTVSPPWGSGRFQIVRST